MIIEKQRIILEKWLLEEVLEKRIEKFKVKIEDLFLVVPGNITGEGEGFVETKFGKLRVFFCREQKSIHILHKSKFNYPKISKAKVMLH